MNQRDRLASMVLILLAAVAFAGCGQSPSTETTAVITTEFPAAQETKTAIPATEEKASPTETPEAIVMSEDVGEPMVADSEQAIEDCREAMPDYSETMIEIYQAWDFKLPAIELVYAFFQEGSSIADDPRSSGTDFEILRSLAEKVEPPACLAEHHERFLAGMDIVLELIEVMHGGQSMAGEHDPFARSENETAILIVALAIYQEDAEWFLENLELVSVDAMAQMIEEIAATDAEVEAAKGPLLDVRVAFMPDGHNFATLSSDDVYVWDGESGEQRMAIEDIPTDDNLPETFSVSPDGRLIATPGCSGACIWDADTGAAVMNIELFFGARNMVFNSDSTQLAIANGGVQTYDVDNGNELLEFGYDIDEAKFSPDGQRLLTTGRFDGVVSIWDVESGDELLVLGRDSNYDPDAFSPDGDNVVTVSDDGSVRIWNVYNGQLLRVFPDANASVAALNSDGTQLATDEEGEVRLWDVATGQRLLTIPTQTNDIYDLAFNPDDSLLAIADSEKTVGLWSVSSGQVLLSLEGHTGDIGSITFSNDGKLLATGSYDKSARVWDAETGEEILILTGHDEGIEDVAFDVDGRRLATASWDGTVRIWDIGSGEELLVLGEPGPGAFAYAVSFSADGERIVTGIGVDMIVWDAETGGKLTTVSAPGYVESAKFTPDDEHIVAIRFGVGAEIREADSGNQVFRLSERIDVNAAGFSPDGTQIITTGCAEKDENGECRQGSILVWATATGREMLRLGGHTDEVYGFDFSPDGGRVVTVSDDMTARIWDLSSGAETMTLAHDHGGLRYATFVNDGQYILTRTSYGLATVWDASSAEMLYSLEDVVSVDFNLTGDKLLIGTGHGKAIVLNSESGEKLLEIDMPAD